MAMMGLAGCSMFGGSNASNTPPPTAAAAPIQPPTAPVAQTTISDVQTALQQAGYYKNEHVDGVWGRGTERAVRQFQRDHHLTANGKLDVPTMQALNLTGAPPSTTGSNNPPDNNPAPPPPPAPSNNPPADSGANQPPR
jgi:peptidoglycan hydrolase-like protein with peptidoglycan-binding domain